MVVRNNTFSGRSSAAEKQAQLRPTAVNGEKKFSSLIYYDNSFGILKPNWFIYNQNTFAFSRVEKVSSITWQEQVILLLHCTFDQINGTLLSIRDFFIIYTFIKISYCTLGSVYIFTFLVWLLVEQHREIHTRMKAKLKKFSEKNNKRLFLRHWSFCKI